MTGGYPVDSRSTRDSVGGGVLARVELAGRSTGRARRWIFLAGALSVAGASAFATWWTTTLYGLPDVGDPFDVAAFVEKPVPDDENAYTLYREAARRIGEEPNDQMTWDWATAGPVEKGWLEQNREPLELWRRGTERPRSLYIPSRSINSLTLLPVVQKCRVFVRLAQLEGSRLEAVGDLEGAWRWHRAIFRASRHVGHHATWIERLVGLQFHRVATRQLTRWSSDPRIRPDLLRKALDAVIADYAMTGPISDNIKVEYLSLIKTYDDPDLVWQCMLDPNSNGQTGLTARISRDSKVFSITKGLMNEPERSRRVTRLIYANFLAACDRPPDRRPPVGATLSIPGSGGAKLLDLHEPDASFPPAAKALSPEKIRQWFDSTIYARNIMNPSFNVTKTADAERLAQANLVIALANRLYESERGHAAAKVEDLVGPYLKALPDGYYQPLNDPPEPRTKP